MEQHPEQAIVGQFANWIRDVNPSYSYWLLVLTNHGIYDAENERIQKLVGKYSQSQMFSALKNFNKLARSETHLDVTLDFFLWLYSEDKALCFRVMKDIYEDFQDDEDIPEPYTLVEKLADFDPTGDERYPEISGDDLVSLSTQVVGEGNEFAFYQYVSNHIAEVEEEVFIVDPYVDKEAIRLYLAETPIGVKKRILTDRPQGNFDDVAEKLVKRSDHRIEVRSTPKCHDRLLFVDDQCFLVGISIKDAGRNPTYVVNFESVDHFREPWEELWREGDVYRVFE